eukprot:359374-Chlamydomonas_euryale.AAC.8
MLFSSRPAKMPLRCSPSNTCPLKARQTGSAWLVEFCWAGGALLGQGVAWDGMFGAPASRPAASGLDSSACFRPPLPAFACVPSIHSTNTRPTTPNIPPFGTIGVPIPLQPNNSGTRQFC